MRIARRGDQRRQIFRFHGPLMAPIRSRSLPGDTLSAMTSKADAPNPPTLVMPPDLIVQELGIRSGELLLTPPQMAAILQTSTDQLSTMREVGDGPPFTKLGDGPKAPVRYHLGKARKWIDGHTFLNTAMVNVSRFATLGDFLSKGSIMDSFIVAMDPTGDVFEFWESVDSQRDIVEARWMRMDHLLEAFRNQGSRRGGEAEADALGGRVPRTGHADTL